MDQNSERCLGLCGVVATARISHDSKAKVRAGIKYNTTKWLRIWDNYIINVDMVQRLQMLIAT